MMIKIIENDGTETYVFEGRNHIAIDMIRFFHYNCGLEVELVMDETNVVDKFSTKENLERAKHYKTEFANIVRTESLGLVS